MLWAFHSEPVLTLFCQGARYEQLAVVVSLAQNGRMCVCVCVCVCVKSFRGNFLVAGFDFTLSSLQNTVLRDIMMFGQF